MITKILMAVDGCPDILSSQYKGTAPPVALIHVTSLLTTAYRKKTYGKLGHTAGAKICKATHIPCDARAYFIWNRLCVSPEFQVKATQFPAQTDQFRVKLFSPPAFVVPQKSERLKLTRGILRRTRCDFTPLQGSIIINLSAHKSVLDIWRSLKNEVLITYHCKNYRTDDESKYAGNKEERRIANRLKYIILLKNFRVGCGRRLHRATLTWRRQAR